MSVAICPAHGWWALYAASEDFEECAERVLFWESNDECRRAIVNDGAGELIPAVLMYRENDFCGLRYDPVSYNDPNVFFPPRPEID